MLHFFKFSEDIPNPVAARPIYKSGPVLSGAPEECPPLRAANSFGWDIVAAFDMNFKNNDGNWEITNPVEIESDWEFGSTDPDDSTEGSPITQRNAWFWEEDQVLPHVIHKDVYKEIKNQVKVSTFLFIKTDPNELLYMCDLPNQKRPYRALSALLDTDWYPASYPWHCVLELSDDEKEITIKEGTPICRLYTVRRDQYFAREMTPEEFGNFFNRSQEWLKRYGKGEQEDMTDITGQYVKQQKNSRFSVIL